MDNSALLAGAVHSEKGWPLSRNPWEARSKEWYLWREGWLASNLEQAKWVSRNKVVRAMRSVAEAWQEPTADNCTLAMEKALECRWENRRLKVVLYQSPSLETKRTVLERMHKELGETYDD